MVKLRVAARVIAENDYNDAQSSAKSERKFLVVVRNPEDWLVGQLAVEVQNTYKRIYKHDLGRVKYLKDADDFDLDPEQLVADVFVNEGKAEQDGFDQKATIKVIQEQGQAVRHGSVVPDLTPVHYQKRPLPPVPRFSEVPTALGKRTHDLSNGGSNPDHRNGAKRGRLAEIGEIQEQDELIPSVERSPDLIQDTQTSPSNDGVPTIKLESPEAQRSFRDKPEYIPATEDELQFLQEAPPNFPNNRRNYVLSGEHVTPTSNGLTQNAARRLRAVNRPSHHPITPPTDPATGGQGSRASGVNGHGHGRDSKSPATGPSSTSTKFKSARKNLYEVLESDIEDSQMSPRAQQPLPVPRLVKSMSSIEKMTNLQQSSYDTFNAQAAWDLMDLDEEANTNEAFIAEKRHSVSMHNDFRNSAPKVTQAARTGSDDGMELPVIASSRQAKSSQDSHSGSQQPGSTGGEAIVVDGQLVKSKMPAMTVPEARPRSAGDGLGKSQVSSEDLKATPSQKKRRRRSRKTGQKEKESAKSVTGHAEETSKTSKDDSVSNEQFTPGGTKRDIFREIKNRRRSSKLDSPGEQLSQQLQESARKKSFSEISSHLTTSEKQENDRPSTSGNGSATTRTPSRRSSLSKTGSSPGRLGLGITNSPRKQKQTQDIGPKEKILEPTLADKLKKVKEDSASQEKPEQRKKMKKQKQRSDDSQSKTQPAEEALLPSVEKSVKKAGRPARLVDDLDKQCAVTKLDGSQCGRALDCDVHTKAAKRAVAGRSQPFDILLDASKQEKRKDKPKDAVPKIPLPQLGSNDVPAAADKSPAPAEARPSQPKASSAIPILPPGMTPDEYARMMEANNAKPFVPKRQKARKNSTPAASVLNPEIKLAATKEGKPKQTKAKNDAMKRSAPAPKIKVTSDAADDTSSSSDTSDSTEEDSDSEKELAQPKKSESKTPSKERATEPEAKKTTASHIRESATPCSDFEAITAKLKSTPMGRSDGRATLKPPVLQLSGSSSDRRSSAASSELPKSEANKVGASLASSNASKPKPTKAVHAEVDKTTKETTPQAKIVPRPVAVASSASSVHTKAAVNNTTSRPAAAPVSTLKQLHQRLRQESRQASNTSSPAPAANNKVFDDDSEESSSSSDSSSSESESESSDSAAKKTSVGAGKSAVPDRSIRDSSPDEESGSDED